MYIIYSQKYKLHNPPFELYDGVRESYAEKKERIDVILSALKKNRIGIFEKPSNFSLKYLNRIHKQEYVHFLKDRCENILPNDFLFPSYFLRDTYAPLVRGTYKAAKDAVNVALTGAQKLLEGESVVYSLCRPPGHHAEYNAMGGYCYFNNAAVAADYLAHYGKIAILDIDFHHGNGTQSSFYDRDDILYVSLHADPRFKYPYISGFIEEKGRGIGFGYTINYPLQLTITNQQYLDILKKALSKIKAFNPKFLVVSAGFDTYKDDPIGGFQMTVPFYEIIARHLISLSVPTLIIQEGGYSVEKLGDIAVSFSKGLLNRPLNTISKEVK